MVGPENEHTFILRRTKALEFVVSVKDETGPLRCRPTEVQWGSV